MILDGHETIQAFVIIAAVAAVVILLIAYFHKGW
jgi:hypothetical protein